MVCSYNFPQASTLVKIAYNIIKIAGYFLPYNAPQHTIPFMKICKAHLCVFCFFNIFELKPE
jgi:hypothetical protein